MNSVNYSTSLKKHWEVIALISGIAIILSLVFSILQPFQYRSSTQVLIIQKQVQNLDAYTATKSAEKIGKNLSTIVYTSSFYNNVIESNINVKNRFSENDIERRKEWERNVKVYVIPETGILSINVYDEDKNYSSQIVRSISYVLVNKGSEYHGGGEDVEMKIVDDVITTKYPVRPNILLNVGVALFLGIILGAVFVVLSEARKANKVTKDQTTIFDEELYLDDQPPADIREDVQGSNTEGWHIVHDSDTVDRN